MYLSGLRVARWAAVSTVAAVVALVAVGTSSARGKANVASFADPAGDAGSILDAPDLTTIDVSNDDTGTITVRVTVANRTALASVDGVAVALDLDQNPDTGSMYYGTEVALALKGNTPSFLLADASGEFSKATPPASFLAQFSGGVVTFSVQAADLGLAPTGGFNLVALSTALWEFDMAPDSRTFNYQLVAGTPPLVPGPDTRAPVDHAIASTGVHGKVARLWFSASDGRGMTSETVRVYRGSKVLKTIHSQLEDTNPFLEYDYAWRVPRTVHGRLRFCVSSTDAAGNTSNVSCAALSVR